MSLVAQLYACSCREFLHPKDHYGMQVWGKENHMVKLLGRDMHALCIDVSLQPQCNRKRMHSVRPDLISTQPICAIKSLI